MKVLHLGKFFHPFQGGIENFLRDISREMSRRSVEVSLLVHHHEPFRRTSHELLDSLQLTRVMSLGQMVYAPIAPSFGRHLLRLIQGFKPDVLHVHVPNLSAFWAIPFASRVPIVIHWHADVVPSRIDRRLSLFYPFYRPLEKCLLSRAAAVIATSENYLDFSLPLREFRGKCRVIPLGVDPARLHRPGWDEAEALRSSYGPHSGMVLSVGRFTYYKGFHVLVEAARSLPDTRFVLVGSGPLRNSLVRRVHELGMAHRFFLPGLLSDRELHGLMAVCDVFCLPSIERTEAFGLVLPEVMFFGKPMVTTSIGGSGVSWVNKDEETGLVAPPCDAEALAASLRRLMGAPAQREQMGARAADRMKARFHVRAVTAEILELYGEVIPS